MKKTIVIIALLFSGCTEYNQRTPVKEITTTIEAFDFGETCPHICWMSISPWKTKKDDALALLEESTIFQKGSLEITEERIFGIWIVNDVRMYVFIEYKQDVITEISIGNVRGMKIGEIIHEMGYPELINIVVESPPDADDFFPYIIYYASRSAAFQVILGDRQGPNPDDEIWGLSLSREVNINEYQNWRGYNHLEEYLPEYIHK
jgi:hypothetical protein